MKFNQCEACQRYNLAAGPEYTTTTRDSQANQSKKLNQRYLRQIIDLESTVRTINIIRGFSLDQATCWETIDKFDDGQASIQRYWRSTRAKNSQPPYQEGHNSHTSQKS
jgi:hypothetical protein